MAREVDSREKELTHQIHRDLLNRHLNEVKSLTPSFISSIKIYLTIKHQTVKKSNSNGLLQAEKNRDYVIKTICDKINEIIRILQLTTYDEDEWLNDDLTIMKQRLVCFERIK
jgi:vinculin